MTIQEAKQNLVSHAINQIGYHEGDNNWNKYAPEWTEAGGWNAQCQPWCDIFVDVMFIEVFGLDLASKLTYQANGNFSALCSASAQFYKQNNSFYQSPEVGDQVFFNVSGGINHTGIVVSVGNGGITTVEGNSSDAVRRNSYTIGSPYIAGYGRPNWSVVVNSGQDSQPTPAPAPEPKPTPSYPTCSVTVTLPQVQYGNSGSAVKLMQKCLIDKGYSCGVWGADGDYGNGTKNGLVAFQRANGLETDYICGKDTWTKLLEVTLNG